MSLITVTNLSKGYGTATVLADISFSLEKNQKIALVGANGTGKTTLLRLLAGIESPDSGTITIAQNTVIGYLPQENRFADTETISSILKHPERVQANDHTFLAHLDTMLSGFGLEHLDLTTPAHTLSSGQRSKLVLANLLLSGVNVLLLDEPTNNIDLPALIWLQDFLKQSDIACIIVSHDRRFLDAVTDKIAIIDPDKRTLSMSGGTYSDYIEQAKKDLRRQKQLYQEQQAEIERLTTVVQDRKEHALRGSRWQPPDKDKMSRGFNRDKAAYSARRAKAIESRVEHLVDDQVERPEERIPLVINLAAQEESGPQEITLKEVVAGYPDKSFALKPLSLEIRFGDRIGIIGLNGSGKSTLVKTITGSLPALSGAVTVGSGLRIGDVLQEHESIPRDEIVVDYFMKKTGLSESLSFAALTKYAFTEWQLRQPISVLSPGGRARLLFATFAILGINVLVLDEPTNHLDIEAQEALEELLESYTGSVILISHDRALLEKTKLSTIYLLEGGDLTKVADYTQYIAQAEKRAKELLRKWQ